MKSFQIRSFFWSVFSHIRTEYGEILNAGKYGPEKTLYLDTFHAEGVCITASGNITLNLFMAPLKTIELLIFQCILAEHYIMQL